MNTSGRSYFNKYKGAIYFSCSVFSFMPKSLRLLIWRMCSGTNGKFGFFLRYVAFKTLAKSCGDNVAIYPNVYVMSFQNISVGNNVSIHPMCYIEGGGGIFIGNDVSIAHSASVLSTSHGFHDTKTPIKYQPIMRRSVNICDNVWIGAKATILYGVEVGEGSVIGAHSLVNRNVCPGAIAAGSPAKTLKYR